VRESVVFAGVTVVVAGLGAAWFLSNFERVDVEERGPADAIVKSNSNYGFSQFLKRYDIESQQLSSLNTRTQMPNTADTLIINFDAIYLTDDETVGLANWVTSGGHLVLPLPYDTEDSLLAYFNIHSGNEDEDDSSESGAAEDDESETDSIDSDDVLSDEAPSAEILSAEIESSDTDDAVLSRYVYEAGFNGKMSGQFSMSYEVYDDLFSNRETLWTLHIEREVPDQENDKRTYALGFQYGLGTISLLSDYAQWNNDNFFEDDNALLSLAALSQTRPPGKVWFVQTIQRASLWQLIWNNAAHLLLWLGLGIVLFFWWAGQRLGRILPNPSLQRREFNEHLIASGRFLWSNKKRDKLLHSAQDALRSRTRQRYPRLHALSTSQGNLHLQDILEEHYKTWLFAMEKPETQTKPHFLDQIKAIQKLWKLL